MCLFDSWLHTKQKQKKVFSLQFFMLLNHNYHKLWTLWLLQKLLILLTASFWVQLKMNLTSGNKEFKISEFFAWGNFSSISYLQLKFIVNCMKAMRVLVDHQIIPFVVRPKSISHKQSRCKIPQTIAVTSLFCLLFSMSKKIKKKRKTYNPSQKVLPM